MCCARVGPNCWKQNPKDYLPQRGEVCPTGAPCVLAASSFLRAQLISLAAAAGRPEGGPDMQVSSGYWDRSGELTWPQGRIVEGCCLLRVIASLFGPLIIQEEHVVTISAGGRGKGARQLQRLPSGLWDGPGPTRQTWQLLRMPGFTQRQKNAHRVGTEHVELYCEHLHTRVHVAGTRSGTAPLCAPHLVMLPVSWSQCQIPVRQPSLRILGSSLTPGT